jgi:hypothetical protein
VDHLCPPDRPLRATIQLPQQTDFQEQKMKLSITLALTAATLSPMVFSQVERDLGSHEHGSATLNVAVDNSALYIELDTPWNNIVGFEHAPTTDDQHALVDAALERLKQPNLLFSFNGGDCTFDALHMENSMSEEEHHDEEHEEEHHDEHNNDTESGESHSTILVSYTYNCTDIASLSNLSIEFFEIWPGFADIDVQLIGSGGQSLAELNAESPELDIKQVQ